MRGAGQPLLANPNALVLHPTTLLFLALPFEAAFKASVILQILLAAVGTWLLLRDTGASRGAALAAAGLLAFSGYMVSLGNLLNLLDSAAFMPLTLWLTGRAVTRGFAPWGSLAALSLAVQVMAGEPAILLVTMAAFGALHWSYAAGATAARGLGTRVAAVTGVALLALSVSMVAVLPTTELLVRSERGAGFDRAEALKWSLPPVALLETGIAHLFGDPTRTGDAGYRGGGTFDAGMPFILSFYLGPVALILAATGLVSGLRAGASRRAEALAMGSVVAGGVVIALGRFLPIYPALLSILPPLRSVRYPMKYFLVVTWAIALLAARGYDASVRPVTPARWRFVLALAFGAGLASAGLALAGAHRGALAGSIARVSILVTLALLLPAFFARRASRIALLALLLLDPIAANVGLNPVTSADFYETPARLAALLERAGGGRSWAAPRPPGFAFRTPQGGDPGSLRWGFLWDRMTLRNATYFDTGQRFAYDRGNERLDVMPGAALGRLLYEQAGASLPPDETTRLLSVAGVDRLITYGGLTGPGLAEADRLEAESRPPIVLVRNEEALPRVYVVSRVEIHPDFLRAARRLREPSFDPRAAVILEEGSAPAAPPPSGADPTPASTARIVEESPTRVVVSCSSPVPGYLVLADTFYPGWRAAVDGEPRIILRANTMFRAVEIPTGAHEVEFLYKPSSVRSGLMVTAAGLLLAGLLAVPRRA